MNEIKWAIMTFVSGVNGTAIILNYVSWDLIVSIWLGQLLGSFRVAQFAIDRTFTCFKLVTWTGWFISVHVDEAERMPSFSLP